MRNPYCIFCSKYFTRGCRGNKQSRIKYKGGWLCEQCIEPYKEYQAEYSRLLNIEWHRRWRNEL